MPEEPCSECGCTHATAYELGRADEQLAQTFDRNVEIANLEFRVVEAAIQFRRAETAVWVESEVGTDESAAQAKAERPRAYLTLINAVDALITAREKHLYTKNDSA